MQARLRRHFQFEQQGGYMSHILAEVPHLEHSAHALLEEHRRLSDHLDSLIVAVAAAPLDSLVTPTWREEVRHWVRLVRDHEAHETRLIQEACNQDIGTKD
jgi:hypothetical protein